MTENSEEKHIDILNQGVRTWNKWREDNPAVWPKISGEDFSGADLSGADFRGADLSRSNFINGNLWGTDLRGANLKFANLKRTNLSGANLGGANLTRADVDETNLIEADMRDVNLSKATLRQAKLRSAYLRRANFRDANLKGANLSETNLIKADFTGADLGDANLSYAYLIRANFTRAKISGVILYGSARDDWKIDGIKCDFVFMGLGKQNRVPRHGNFSQGEFEERFKQLPTIEYCFKSGFTAVDGFIMEQVVNSINQDHPEFELMLDSFLLRGQPRAIFTIVNTDYADEAYKQIKSIFESRTKITQGEAG